MPLFQGLALSRGDFVWTRLSTTSLASLFTELAMTLPTDLGASAFKDYSSVAGSVNSKSFKLPASKAKKKRVAKNYMPVK